eukprot:6383281-Alexandrium_andersonii.AAC.1
MERRGLGGRQHRRSPVFARGRLLRQGLRRLTMHRGRVQSLIGLPRAKAEGSEPFRCVAREGKEVGRGQDVRRPPVSAEVRRRLGRQGEGLL